MNSRVLLIPLIAAAFATATATAGEKPAREKTAPTDEKPAASSEAKPAAKKPGLPAIRIGMEPEAILKTVGRPDKIERMDTPEGPAEIWIYRRVVEQQSVPVQTGTVQRPAFTGVARGDYMGTVDEPVYSIEERTIYQVTRLLILNGKLAASKQAKEMDRIYTQ